MTTRRLLLVFGSLAAAAALVAGLYFGRAGFSADGRDAATLLAITLPDASGTPQTLALGSRSVDNGQVTTTAPCDTGHPPQPGAASRMIRVHGPVAQLVRAADS